MEKEYTFSTPKQPPNAHHLTMPVGIFPFIYCPAPFFLQASLERKEKVAI
jgi:hypothetical protein